MVYPLFTYCDALPLSDLKPFWYLFLTIPVMTRWERFTRTSLIHSPSSHVMTVCSTGLWLSHFSTTHVVEGFGGCKDVQGQAVLVLIHATSSSMTMVSNLWSCRNSLTGGQTGMTFFLFISNFLLREGFRLCMEHPPRSGRSSPPHTAENLVAKSCNASSSTRLFWKISKSMKTGLISASGISLISIQIRNCRKLINQSEAHVAGVTAYLSSHWYKQPCSTPLTFCNILIAVLGG